MTKAGALKKRYVMFRLEGQKLEGEQLKHAFHAEALKFFGEYGLSHAALKLVSFDAGRNVGVLRCERGHQDSVLGFLALVSSLGGSPARLVTLKSSGTLKSLESVEESTHER